MLALQFERLAPLLEIDIPREAPFDKRLAGFIDHRTTLLEFISPTRRAIMAGGMWEAAAEGLDLSRRVKEEQKERMMLQQAEIIRKARELGFADTGFTTADPFEEHRQMLLERQEEYGWAERVGLDLLKGTDPDAILPGAKSIIVLIENYFSHAYPRSMEGIFGRCYLDDDRVTKDGRVPRIKAFRAFLREDGITAKVPFNLPHRRAQGQRQNRSPQMRLLSLLFRRRHHAPQNEGAHGYVCLRVRPVPECLPPQPALAGPGAAGKRTGRGQGGKLRPAGPAAHGHRLF